jgi:hypothetical protein
LMPARPHPDPSGGGRGRAQPERGHGTPRGPRRACEVGTRGGPQRALAAAATGCNLSGRKPGPPPATDQTRLPKQMSPRPPALTAASSQVQKGTTDVPAPMSALPTRSSAAWRNGHSSAVCGAPAAVTGQGRAGIAVGMDDEPQPVPAEELVGKDELDEDDEMVLSADDLVADRDGRTAGGGQ